MLHTLRQDIRYAARGLRTRPGFTAAAVVTLALGIGANAAMFSIVDRMLLRPPPMLRDPATAHQIYVYETYRGRERAGTVNEYARYVDLTRDTRSFSATAGYRRREMAVGTGEAAREMSIAAVSASFFGFFDAPPAVGRYFDAGEDALPAGQAVAVLGFTYWQTAYGERTDALGSKLQIGPTTYTIIGVAPKGFAGLWPSRPPVAYIPITSYAAAQSAGFGFLKNGETWWNTYHWGWMSMMARRKPDVSITQANADLTHALRLSYLSEAAKEPTLPPMELAKPHGLAASILDERGPNTSQLAKVAAWVGGVSVIVLLIACANVANLLLVRALRRRREIAVRLALGVSRGRLLAQLLTESLMLAVLGGAAGVVVAQWGGGILRAALLPKTGTASVLGDPRTLLFAGAAALVVGLLTGLAPIAQAARGGDTLLEDLKTGAREGTYRRSRTRVVLIVGQAALSVMLLVGAGVFVRSLQHVRSQRLGYDVDPVAIIGLNMRGVKHDSAHAYALVHQLLESAREIPGVTNAALIASTPLMDHWSISLYVQGIDTVRRLGRFQLNAVSPDFFRTFGTRVLRGRGITRADTRTAPRVMVVSEGMADRLWPGRDAIGQCVRVQRDTMPCTTVVGITEDIHESDIAGDSATYTYYLSAEQFDGNGGLAVRTAGPATAYAEALRRGLQRDMPGASYVTVTPFSDVIGRATRSWTLGATMFVAFGLLALVLAGIGLYSTIAYSVAQRTHELGVRVALGAQMRDVVMLVVRDGALVGVAGVVLGAGAALGTSRWLAPLLFHEAAADPVVFATVSATLLAVSVAASWIPARRAARIDPQVALRSD